MILKTDVVKQRIYWGRDRGHRKYNHPVVNFFARQRIGYLLNFLNLKKVKRALDVGCGSGFSTYYLKEYVEDIYGIDRSDYMLKQHPFYNSGKLFVADTTALPFPNNSFDLVFGWEVLHHLDNPGLALAEMVRVSRCYVLIVEPNCNNPVQFLFSLLDREHRWALKYNLVYLRKLFEAVGLEVKHLGQGGWIFPNKTPLPMLAFLKKIRYQSSLGISNWIMGVK
jgi:SAM-dependent methyltransferase